MEQPDASLCSWCFDPRGEITITTISLCKKKKFSLLGTNCAASREGGKSTVELLLHLL